MKIFEIIFWMFAGMFVLAVICWLYDYYSRKNKDLEYKKKPENKVKIETTEKNGTKSIQLIINIQKHETENSPKN